MGLLARINSSLGAWLTKATVEGQPRPGPYLLPITGGLLPVGTPDNWWQLGQDPIYAPTNSALVEACVSAYAQTIAMCPGDHWRTNNKGGRERVKNSALSRVLRSPNTYQSMSDFMLNATRSLYLDGNAYALALRNDRFEIAELHLMNPRLCSPVLAMTGDVFYRLGGNHVIDNQLGGAPLALVPQRDVLHVKLHCSRRFPFPLVGESPLMAAMADLMAMGAMNQQQVNFYLNQSRPSAVLSTDLTLDKDAVQILRDRWNEQARGLNSGGVPILTSGLKVQPWTTSAKDAELAEVMKISDQHIALVFRIPLQILGLGGGTSYSSTELLMQSWIASGLGFALNHIEEAFGLLWSLKGQPDEYCEFDTSALLRSAQKERIDALARAVQGGILSPNEARALEGYDAVKYGDEPRVQQQVVPLSQIAKTPAPPGPGAPPAPAGPAGPDAQSSDSAAPDTTPPSDSSAKQLPQQETFGDVVARHQRSLLAAARDHDLRHVA